MLPKTSPTMAKIATAAEFVPTAGAPKAAPTALAIKQAAPRAVALCLVEYTSRIMTTRKGHIILIDVRRIVSAIKSPLRLESPSSTTRAVSNAGITATINEEAEIKNKIIR